MSAPRVTTAIRFPEATHRRLKAAAAAHGVSANYLVVKAVDGLLARLLPPDEVSFTREGE